MKQEIRQNDTLLGWLLHAAGVAVLALVVGLFYLCFYLPLENKQQSHVLRTEQISTLLAESQGTQQKHQELRNQLLTLQKTLETTRPRLPNEALQAQFVSQVSHLAKSAGLEIVDYQQGTIQKAPTHSKAEVQFQCNGSYASMCRFLLGINQLTRITKISKLSLESDKNFDRYPLQVTFVLYYGVPTHDTNETRGVL